MIEDISFNGMNDFDGIAVCWNKVEPATGGNVAFTTDAEDACGDRVAVAKTVKQPAINVGVLEGLLNCWNDCVPGCLHARTLARLNGG